MLPKLGDHEIFFALYAASTAALCQTDIWVFRQHGPSKSLQVCKRMVIDWNWTKSQQQEASDAPKRPSGHISAFNYFVKNTRPRLLDLHPHLKEVTNNEVNKILGHLWRKAPDTVVEDCERLSAKDRERFTKEMNIYRQKQAENSASTSSVNLSRSQTCTQSGQFSKPQIQQGQRHRVSDSADECTEGADRRKRGRTVYSWFLEQECKYLQAAVGASSETSALVGERWRAMTRTEREFSAALYGSCEGNMAH